MNISADALEIVCQHLDVRSIVHLAATDSATRSKIEKCTIHVREPVAMVLMNTPILKQLVCYQRVLYTNHLFCAIAWCPHSRRIACSLHDNSIHIYDIQTGQMLWNLQDHVRPVPFIAWSPDGSELVSVSTNTTIHIWNMFTGLTRLIIQSEARDIQSVTWTSEGIKLATNGTLARVHTWDATTGQVIGVVQCFPSTIFELWSPDCTKLLSEGFGTMQIHDASTGTRMHKLRGHTAPITIMRWSPDSTKVLSGSRDTTVRIWDATTGQVLQILQGHTETVISVGWSADGTKVVSGSYDKTARVWDVATGQELQVLRGHRCGVTNVQWSRDGSKIATHSRVDKTIRVWNV